MIAPARARLRGLGSTRRLKQPLTIEPVTERVRVFRLYKAEHDEVAVIAAKPVSARRPNALPCAVFKLDDPKKVAAQMKSGQKFKTVIGELSFDKKGDVTRIDYVVYVWKKNPEGKITYRSEERRVGKEC